MIKSILNDCHSNQTILVEINVSVMIIGLTACVTQTLLNNKDWDWEESLLFGSILSATDPVAVVALLKEIGKPYEL